MRQGAVVAFDFPELVRFHKGGASAVAVAKPAGVGLESRFPASGARCQAKPVAGFRSEWSAAEAKGFPSGRDAFHSVPLSHSGREGQGPGWNRSLPERGFPGGAGSGSRRGGAAPFRGGAQPAGFPAPLFRVVYVGGRKGAVRDRDGTGPYQKGETGRSGERPAEFARQFRQRRESGRRSGPQPVRRRQCQRPAFPEPAFPPG